MRCAILGSWCVLGLVPAAIASHHSDRHLARPIELGVQRVLIDRQLVEHRIDLIALGTDTISYHQHGQRRDEPIERFVALAAPPAWINDLDRSPHADPHPWQRLDLIDGQRLVGVLEPDRPAIDESLVWRLPTIGRLVVPLDRIRTITLGPAAAPPPSSTEATSDRIVLLNGDTLDGFVAHIGAKVAIEHTTGSQHIPIERIARIALANPPTVASSPLVWLADGSVLAVDGFGAMASSDTTMMLRVVTDAQDGSSSPVQPPHAPTAVPIDLGRVGAVLFEPARLVPLATMRLLTSVPLGDRRWAEPAQTDPPSSVLLGASDITLPGPMRLEWQLPPSATRVAFEAILPHAMRGWGDCTLVVIEADAQGHTRQLASERLYASRPIARINTGLSQTARTLTLELRQGNHGPIQDRVVLRRPLVLVGGPGNPE